MKKIICTILALYMVNVNANTKINDFLLRLRLIESNRNWKAVNQYGYIGYYQFGKIALKDIGIKISTKDFIKNPQKFNAQQQNKAIHKLLKLNEKRLTKYIKKYNGKTINGIKISKGGILAAAHLLGARKVKIWFNNGCPLKGYTDGNGMNIIKYFKNFQRFNPEL